MRGIAVDLKVAVVGIGAGLGEDLDTAVADAVVLGRKGVLVDADFADGGLWWKLAAGEAVDVDLAAVGAGGGTGERGEFAGKLVWIIGKGIQILALNDGRVRVRIGVNGERNGVRIHVDHDFLLADLQLCVNGQAGDRSDAKVLHRIGTEAGHGDEQVVRSGHER